MFVLLERIQCKLLNAIYITHTFTIYMLMTPLTSKPFNDNRDMHLLRFRDTPFVQLMNKRIYNVLIIASQYDMFILEDDGRVDEQIFNEYTSLNLRYPPRFTQVADIKDAIEELKVNRFELIICMPNMDDHEIFSKLKIVDDEFPKIPIVLLTPFSKSVTRILENEDLSSIDYVFSWLGNADLLLAIIKLIEDQMNVEHDVETVGVQTIMLVEDSVRFYSSALPLLYKYVLNESKQFSKEALNDHLRMMRMRGRPKILFARNYEEAVSLFNKYGNNMLGIITDITFSREGQKDPIAGKRLGEWVRGMDRYIPLIYTSSETANSVYAKEVGATFVDKNSKMLPLEIHKAIKDNFGFGDFIIVAPKSQEEIFRIKNLKELMMKIKQIPDDSFYFHLSHGHFARFFYTRAMYPVAEMLRQIDISEYKSMDEARELIYQAIVEYRRMKNSGVVAIFEKDRYDKYSNFARIGDGSLGGKGRGLAFIGHIVKTHFDIQPNEELPILTPKTVVLCTDIFDEFMEANNLYDVALSDIADENILKHFLSAKLPKRLTGDFFVFIDAVSKPIAIRSSSLLEDSQYQPFAGIYSTYMIPYVDDKFEMVRLLSNSIKAVYASVFFKDSKAYMSSTHNLIDQEKMAIVLQEIVGQQYDSLFYPAISGVARSINYYPIGNEQSDDGIVDMAMGLGKYIVEGENGLRFSPRHSHNILQLSTLDLSLRDTQTQFYALDLNPSQNELTVDDGFNLRKVRVQNAGNNSPLRYITSTYDPNDQIIRDGFCDGGRKIVSFANILKHDTLPLAETLEKVLKIGEKGMGRPVEIEFAVDIESQKKGQFYILQIRPIVDNKEVVSDDLENIDKSKLLFHSFKALGNGVTTDVFDVVYVKTKGFSAVNNPQIAHQIENINEKFRDSDSGYILAGPGRWGSSDHWLGVSVKWAHICQARVIVELSLENYQIEPSQGTHFFQNLTSFGVGYFTINPFSDQRDFFDEEYLNGLPAVSETEFVRHVRLDKPMTIKINGKKRVGVVMKPQ